MCTPDFNLFAKKAPAIKNYDVHIYFGNDPDHPGAELGANILAERLLEAVPGAKGPFYVKAGMGPHVFPNVEVTIPPEVLSKTLTLLQLNNPGLSILVHPHTGDEILDHTTLANWVGKPVPLKLATLAQPAPRKIVNNRGPQQK